MHFSIAAVAAALCASSSAFIGIEAFIISLPSHHRTTTIGTSPSQYNHQHHHVVVLTPSNKKQEVTRWQQHQKLYSSVNGADELADIAAALVDDETSTDTSSSSSTTSEKIEEEEEDELLPFKLILEEPPGPPSYQIESIPNSSPGNSGSVHTLTINLGAPGTSDPIILQTGKIGRQASGAVTLTRGNTVLYATASRDNDPRPNIDFVPLSVEHQERFSSAGLTSGAFNKRDGRPAEHEILVCRLIDRPLRPLIAQGWAHETQLLSWILSYDGERTCDPLAITASAAALWLSDVPLLKPVAAAMVGYIDDTLVLNPTIEQMEHSTLNLIIAGTKDAVLMIEGAANFLPESLMIKAVSFGHDAIKIQCEGLEELGKVAGKPKMYDTIPPKPEGLQEIIDELYTNKIDEIYGGSLSKEDQSSATSELSKLVVDEMEEQYPEQKSAIKSALKDLMCRRMFNLAKTTGLRIDGRALDEVRTIDSEAGLFPRVHGSALFTRGQTQVVATATLGDSGMRQKIDSIAGLKQKRFYLQYTFPPSCVGETGRIGMPGRREVGHGNLAERALLPALPSEETFPYTIRVESLVTESNGSSSMASVCGGCLALMDAGVPITSPVAVSRKLFLCSVSFIIMCINLHCDFIQGIAMGMLLGDKSGLSDENAVIVSDILGQEDALGTMDFKVAGNKEGITTFQLDIKCEGLTLQTMERALDQAKAGRLHILGEMEKVLDKPRSELPATVPKVIKTKISEESIGKVIGPGGKQIRAIIEDFGLSNMDVEEDGSIQISGFDLEQMEKAKDMITLLTSSMGGSGGRGGRGGGGGGGGGSREPRQEYAGPPPEEGKIYTGKITGIHQFGVFLEILPGAEDGSTPGLEGLCHVSELHVEHVRNCEGFIRGMNTETLEGELLFCIYTLLIRMFLLYIDLYSFLFFVHISSIFH